MNKKQLIKLLKYNFSYSDIGKMVGNISRQAIYEKTKKLSEEEKQKIKDWRKTKAEKIMEKNLEETIIRNIFE